jgi:hypothetical protein
MLTSDAQIHAKPARTFSAARGQVSGERVVA